MVAYTRQSASSIINGSNITAAPLNAEFNKVVDTFSNTTGHRHDGTVGEGPVIGMIGDPGLLQPLNKVVVDDSFNMIRFYIDASGAGSTVEQVRIQDGAISPAYTNDVDLGTNSAPFKDIYLQGNISALGNVSIGGTLNTTALTTLSSLTVTSSSIMNSITLTGDLGVSGSVDINAGTVDGAVIGGASAQAVTGTLVTATTNFAGDLTGNVTGNATGNVTGNLTGNVTGDVTGNVTASSGTSSVNNLTVNGTLNMNAGTTATITNLTSPSNTNDAATKGYVDTSLASLVDSAPNTLDTLNELAAALGDDANFSTTITNSIATRLPLAGGTITGPIAMSTNKITGLGDPTANQDAASKAYTDTQRDSRLALAGGTLTGAITMGANKVTATYTPSANTDLTNKSYVDGILGSATSAATSSANAATSATNSATSATNSSNSAAAALASQNAAAASFDSFDDRYLGAKSSPPSVDNDGSALLTGAIYWNTTSNNLFIWTGSAWNSAAFDVGTALFDADIGSTVQAYDATTPVDLGDWTVTESGGSLYFATSGTNKMKLDASGNLDVVGSVNTNATIS